MDPVLTAVLSVAGGAVGATVLTVSAGFFGAWLQARREHARWLREKRMDAYLTLLTVFDGNAMYMQEGALGLPHAHAQPDFGALNKVVSAVKLLGPAILNDKASAFHLSVGQILEGGEAAFVDYQFARETFVVEARNILAIDFE